MVEETPGCIPLPRCPHSLIPKDAIKHTSCASRGIVHQLPALFLCGDIDGPGLQRSMLSESSSSILPTWHHAYGLLVCSLSRSIFVQREKVKRKEKYVIKLLSSFLNCCHCWLFAIYLTIHLIQQILKKISYVLL
jgi:hypothetical protein